MFEASLADFTTNSTSGGFSSATPKNLLYCRNAESDSSTFSSVFFSVCVRNFSEPLNKTDKNADFFHLSILLSSCTQKRVLRVSPAGNALASRYILLSCSAVRDLSRWGAKTGVFSTV